MKRGIIFSLVLGLAAALTFSGCELATLIVTYDGNGNTAGTAPVDAETYGEGKTVTALGNTGALAKAGYLFACWNTEPGGGGTDILPWSEFVMGAADRTLYAKWVPTIMTRMSGSWLMYFDWAPPSPSDPSVTWFLANNGTFTIDVGDDYGTWDVTGFDFILHYSTGGLATYVGTIAPDRDSMSGTMYTDSNHGTWTAIRIVPISMAPAEPNEGMGSSGAVRQ